MFSGYVVLNVIIHKLGNMLYLMFEIGLMSLLYVVIAQKCGFNIIVSLFVIFTTQTIRFGFFVKKRLFNK